MKVFEAKEREGRYLREMSPRLLKVPGSSAAASLGKLYCYSHAYFDLVARLPGLRPYLALGERVIIAGDGLSISLTETGLTRWGRRDLKAVTEAFAALD